MILALSRAGFGLSPARVPLLDRDESANGGGDHRGGRPSLVSSSIADEEIDKRLAWGSPD
jgi:hypothetical protein